MLIAFILWIQGGGRAARGMLSLQNIHCVEGRRLVLLHHWFLPLHTCCSLIWCEHNHSHWSYNAVGCSKDWKTVVRIMHKVPVYIKQKISWYMLILWYILISWYIPIVSISEQHFRNLQQWEGHWTLNATSFLVHWRWPSLHGTHVIILSDNYNE